MTAAAGVAVRAPAAAPRDAAAPSRARLRVAGIVAAAGALTAALTLGPILSAPAVTAPLHLSWWLLVPLFVLVEVCVMHIHVRNDAHSLSLSEIALLVGLVFSAPWELLLAQFVGAGLALALHRRQRFEKLVFNLASLSLSAAVSVVVFHGLLGHRSPASPAGWIAGGLAAEASFLVSGLLVCAVMAWSGPSFTAAQAWRLLGGGAATTAATTSVGLLVVTVLWFQPAAMAMLPLPMLVVFAAYRGYSAQHDHARDLAFLYETARTLSQTDDVERALPDLVARTRAMFRARLAEMIVLPSDGDEMAYRVTAGDDGPGPMEPTELSALDEALIELSVGCEGMLVRQGRHDRVLSRLLTSRRLKDALIVPLRGEMRMTGLLLLGNHHGDVNAFTASDLTLLAALGDQVSIALQNGRLERSLGRLLELQLRLRSQAFQDPLTGLPNRVGILETLRERGSAAASSGGCVGLLLVDVDGFGRVNESLGGSSADAVLVTVARRLQALLAEGDVVGRMSADEFAVIVDVKDPGEDVVERLAGRIHAAVAHAIPVDTSADLSLTVSVGAVLEIASSTAEEMLARAAGGLARAKRRGGGCTETSRGCSAVVPLRSPRARTAGVIADLDLLRREAAGS